MSHGFSLKLMFFFAKSILNVEYFTKIAGAMPCAAAGHYSKIVLQQGPSVVDWELSITCKAVAWIAFFPPTVDDTMCRHRCHLNAPRNIGFTGKGCEMERSIAMMQAVPQTHKTSSRLAAPVYSPRTRDQHHYFSRNSV